MSAAFITWNSWLGFLPNEVSLQLGTVLVVHVCEEERGVLWFR